MIKDAKLYPMIFKRKSFHLYRSTGNEKLSIQEITEIYDAYEKLTPLVENIKTVIKIVPADKTNCNRGEEYCILIYSEKKDNYLQNVGYIGQQLDLFLVSRNIGTLWFGIGRPNEANYKGLNFVIMIAISKVDDENKFRRDMFKSKRKSVEEIWTGDTIHGVTDLVRFAPSSCNTQPWIVERENKVLHIYRYKKPGKRGIMPADLVSFYNRIDMGIFMCFLELCLVHEGIKFECELFTDTGSDAEKTLAAVYLLLQ